MVVEIKADVDNARAIANDMDSYGESVSESAGRCGQEAYSRDTAFGKEFMRSASAYTQLLQGTGANIGEAMSGFSFAALRKYLNRPKNSRWLLSIRLR